MPRIDEGSPERVMVPHYFNITSMHESRHIAGSFEIFRDHNIIRARTWTESDLRNEIIGSETWLGDAGMTAPSQGGPLPA
jgi:hypothetical protein